MPPSWGLDAIGGITDPPTAAATLNNAVLGRVKDHPNLNGENLLVVRLKMWGPKRPRYVDGHFIYARRHSGEFDCVLHSGPLSALVESRNDWSTKSAMVTSLFGWEVAEALDLKGLVTAASVRPVTITFPGGQCSFEAFECEIPIQVGPYPPIKVPAQFPVHARHGEGLDVVDYTWRRDFPRENLLLMRGVLQRVKEAPEYPPGRMLCLTPKCLFAFEQR